MLGRIKVAINGFGRIGRMVLKAGLNDRKIDFVAVNDLATKEQLAYLLKYDSIQQKFSEQVLVKDDQLIVGKRKIQVFNEKSPELLPWKKLKIDVVVESTGIFRKYEDVSKHIQAGAKKVLLSAPGKDNKIPTYLIGVNDEKYRGENIISNASCTTNCIAPIAKILNDNIAIKKGFLTTVHAYTSTQALVDAPNKDFRRGRAAALNLIPTTTGAAKSLGDVIPELKGKCDGIAIRAPIATGSIIDFVAELTRKTSVEEINSLFKNAANKQYKGILQYTEEPLVSSDVISSPYSAIFDAKSTYVIDNLVKVLAWYDNEYGYSCRMIDMIKLMASK